MKYVLCRAWGEHIETKEKYTQNTLFHLGCVEIISSPYEGVIRGVFL